ncbi:MAG: GNAT family N-acetyltransferase [Actinomycetes bacterium]
MTGSSSGSVRRFNQTDVDGWWRATQAYRDADPLLTNVISSVATGVRNGRYDDARLWAVTDGHVVGAAIQTPPLRVLLGPMTELAARAVASDVLTLQDRPAGFAGPLDAANAAAAHVAELTGATVSPGREELLRVLREYTPPPPTPGRARRARPDDAGELESVADVMTAFHDELGQVGHDNRRAAEERLQSGWWWWEVDGERVAAAAHAPLVETPRGAIGRIGPVWTAPAHRRCGYAAAVTAAVTEQLLPRCHTVMLYTDAANATSNGVYARLGFETTAEVGEVSLQW